MRRLCGQDRPGLGLVDDMTVRTAIGLIAWYIRATGCRGWTSFWNVIYVLPGNENNERLLRHERRHLEQIERDGRVLFSTMTTGSLGL